MLQPLQLTVPMWSPGRCPNLPSSSSWVALGTLRHSLVVSPSYFLNYGTLEPVWPKCSVLSARMAPRH